MTQGSGAERGTLPGSPSASSLGEFITAPAYFIGFLAVPLGMLFIPHVQAVAPDDYYPDDARECIGCGNTYGDAGEACELCA